MKHFYHAFILICCSLPIILPAQNIELAWQPHEYAKIGLVKGVTGGTISGTIICTSIPHPEGYQYPKIAKVDDQGNMLWSHEFSIFDYSVHFWPIDIIERSNGEILITYNTFDCDFPSPSGLVRFSDLGIYIEHWQIPGTQSVIDDAIFQDTSANSPLLFWQWNSLFRWSNFSLNSEALPVKIYQNHLTQILRQENGRILLNANDSIVVFNTATDSLDGPLVVLDKIIFGLCNGEDNDIYAVGDSVIWLIDQNGNVTDSTHIPGRFREIWYHGDFVYIKQEFNPKTNLILVFTKDLQFVRTIEPFSTDTRLEGVSFSNDHHWVWGNETYNGFIKAIDFQGNSELPNHDAAILDMNYGAIKSHTIKKYGVYLNPTVTLQEVSVQIFNNGQTTLNNLYVNWNSLIFPPAPPNCTNHEKHHFISGLNLAPGESGWFEVPDILYQIDIPLSTVPYNLNWNVCLNLSTPNARVDFDHDNDRLCRSASTIILTADEAASLTFEISPNPFSHTLSLKDIPDHWQTVEFYNTLGQSVYTAILNGPTQTLTLPPSGPGLIWCIFRDGQGRFTHQLPLIREE